MYVAESNETAGALRYKLSPWPGPLTCLCKEDACSGDRCSWGGHACGCFPHRASLNLQGAELKQ